MPVTIMCPNLTCRAVLRVPDNVRGKRVRCGQCMVVFSVPTTKPACETQSNAANSPSDRK